MSGRIAWRRVLPPGSGRRLSGADASLALVCGFVGAALDRALAGVGWRLALGVTGAGLTLALVLWALARLLAGLLDWRDRRRGRWGIE